MLTRQLSLHLYDTNLLIFIKWKTSNKLAQAPAYCMTVFLLYKGVSEVVEKFSKIHLKVPSLLCKQSLLYSIRFIYKQLVHKTSSKVTFLVVFVLMLRYSSRISFLINVNKRTLRKATYNCP